MLRPSLHHSGIQGSRAPVTLARHAMATRFEVVLYGDNAVSLRAAGEGALDEIERLEAQLSLYRPSSEIAHVNALATREPVRVSPSVFALLEHARRLSQETEGAFDITVAPLVRCWGFMDNRGRLPGESELAEARASVGMHLVELDPANFTVRFKRPGVMLDLGAIGKGYAVERAAELLVEAGVRSALLHGGTSTVFGLGQPPEAESWTVALESPPQRPGQKALQTPIATVSLCNEALSVSAMWGRSFEHEGKLLGHVLDPRTGRPVQGALLSAVVLPSATETDALSTALLIAGWEKIAGLRPGMRTLRVSECQNQLVTEGQGIAARL